MQDPLPIKPLSGPFNAVMRPPGSKSLTNRALLLAALAEGESTLSNVLFADDTEVMMEALKALGFKLDIDEPNLTVKVHGQGGRIPAKRAELFLGNAGTAMRFLTAACCLGEPGSEYVLDGVQRMHERPIGELVDALRQLGAKIDYLGKEGFPPLLIHGGGLLTPSPSQGEGRGEGKTSSRHSSLTLRPTLSSQYISALLQIGPCLPKGLEIKFDGPITSQPYVQMTQRLMHNFGIATRTQGNHESIFSPHGAYKPLTYSIENDASNASYFLATAAIKPGSECKVPGLGGNHPVQGDAGFAWVLQEMGASGGINADGGTWIAAPEDKLKGGIHPLNDMPDMAQTLAVVALFANGETVIQKIGNLRVKETDRIEALRKELTKLGAKVTVKGDDIHIIPPKDNILHHPDGTPISDEKPVVIETYDDHRMAMSFAVAGLCQPGIRIKNPACVNKTYPDFFKDLATLEHGGNAR